MAVIHKRYRADGVADLTAWIFDCDNCHDKTTLTGVSKWLLPCAAFRRDDATTRIYCRTCVRNLTQAPLFTSPPHGRSV